MPGFVDLHTHMGGAPKAPDAEYVYKLWLAHGVTSTRGVPSGPMDWTLRERARSARNEITAPRIFAYHRPGTGEGWTGGVMTSPAKAREWVDWAAGRGIDGLKLLAEDPEIMKALVARARELGLGATAHLSQTGLARMNVRDAVRLGLPGMEHFYGLLDSLLRDYSIQPYPATTTTSTSSIDSVRSPGSGTRSTRAAARNGTSWWRSSSRRTSCIDPTLTIYAANRDLMRARTADWHDTYTLPTLWDFYQPIARGTRLVLVLLDHRGRGRLEELLSRLDVVPERLQEPRRSRHDGLGLRLHLQALRLRLHRRAGTAPGSRVPSARSDSLGHALWRASPPRTEGQADRVRTSCGRDCSPTWSWSIRTRCRI